MPIEQCGRSVCVEATIVNDTALEGTELFFITLDRGLERVAGSGL